MPTSIVDDQKDTGSGVFEKVAEEILEGFPIEAFGGLDQETTRFQTDSPEESNLLSGGGGENLGLLPYRGPGAGHGGGSMEMDFVLGPNFYRWILEPSF